MRIDSHQHFWQRARNDYGWLTQDLGPIWRDFTPADLAPLLAASHIDKTVVVQAAPTVAETEFLFSLAEETDFIAGVVGWVDMEDPGAAETLSRLAANSYFKGVRPMIQDIADPKWMLKPALNAAFQHIIAAGLCFDALVKPIHLSHLFTLLERYPDLKVVIDHGGKPDIAGGHFKEWAAHIGRLAEHTGALCKLSGFLTEAQPAAGYAEVKPYIQHLLSCFGADRLMWGSDWPVLNLVNDYQGWLAITEQSLQSLTADERRKIMGENAASFYQLEISHVSGC